MPIPQPHLRKISLEDRDHILEILTSESVGKTFMLPVFQKKEDAIPLFLRLRELSSDPTRYVRCIDLQGNPIGFINDISQEHGTVEIGYVIHPDYQGRGYMTAALNAAIVELACHGFQQLITGAFAENTASIRVMEKCGMIRLSKTDEISYRNEIHSCVYYSRILNGE